MRSEMTTDRLEQVARDPMPEVIRDENQLDLQYRHLTNNPYIACLVSSLRAAWAQRDKFKGVLESSNAAARRRGEERNELRVVLESVEWCGSYELVDACPSCQQAKEDGHKPDCRLAKALSLDPL